MKELLKAYVNSCNERLPEEQMKLLSDDLLESLFYKRMTNMYLEKFLNYEIKYFKKYFNNLKNWRKNELLYYGFSINDYDNLDDLDNYSILKMLDYRFQDFYDFCMDIDWNDTRQINKYKYELYYIRFKILLYDVINSYHKFRDEFIKILHKRNFFRLNDILSNNDFFDIIYLLQMDRKFWFDIIIDINNNNDENVKKLLLKYP